MGQGISRPTEWDHLDLTVLDPQPPSEHQLRRFWAWESRQAAGPTLSNVWRFARRCKVRELHVRNVTVGAIRRHLDRLDEQRRARERRLFSPQQQTLLLPIGFLQLHLMRAVAERQRRLDAQSDTFAPAPPYASFAQPATGSKRTTRGSWPHVAAAPSPDDAYSAADDADDHELNEPAPRGRGVAAESRKPSLPRPARTGQLWALQ